ncbi:complement C1r subcomponent-like [Hemitrygon akajei]|uniref:complement C1r subcomponent-like n=1 Tax=Hemitrygon akajei TaxID=2704970 RepID=UPI003BF94C1B
MLPGVRLNIFGDVFGDTADLLKPPTEGRRRPAPSAMLRWAPDGPSAMLPGPRNLRQLSIARWSLLVSVLALVTSSHGSSMFGEITSPGYPSSYPNKNQSEWTIGVPLGYRVQLHFRHFQLEPSQDCVYDRLKVSSGGKALGIFCGNDDSDVGNPPRGQILTSTGNTMKLEFQSDFSNEGKFLGFLLYYEAIDVDECSVQEGPVPVCEHLCQNTLGSYQCACRRGYQLRDDGRSCQEIVRLALVIVSPGRDVHQLLTRPSTGCSHALTWPGGLSRSCNLPKGDQ